jgi:uncharacterized repeat protein (TIGR03803 family)
MQMKTNTGLQNTTLRLGVFVFGGWLLVMADRLPAQTYIVLHDFNGADGLNPSTLVRSGETLYGTTMNANQAGAFSAGNIFRINTDGSGFQVLKSFAYRDGVNPFGGLVVSNSVLYGVTESGGTGGGGTIYRINTDGSDFAVLWNFGLHWGGIDDGGNPAGGLALSGTTLYGTTSRTGEYDYGTVFKISTDGSGFANLKEFQWNDGAYPWGDLLLSGATLYGTTAQGGITNIHVPYGEGTVFKLGTGGEEFTLLKEFYGGNEGGQPFAGLVMSGDTLYGTTSWQAINTESNCGTVFRLNSDGSGFTTLKALTNFWSDGMFPSRLSLAGEMLYGTTEFGGTSGYEGNGTVFRMKMDGSDFTVLKNFNGDDGACPIGGLAVEKNTLCGTTRLGGAANAGVIFALGFAPTNITVCSTQTAEMGSDVNFTAWLGGASRPAGYQWSFNGTNLLNGATNAGLHFTNIQPSQAGSYTVFVSNQFGSATSAPAMLQVVAPIARRTVPAIRLSGNAGGWLKLDYTSALSPVPSWLPLDTVNLLSPSQFYFDLSLPLPPQRFYRARPMDEAMLPPSSTLPGFIPALTLTGNVGDHLRLDYINQFGPVEAWAPLATITLTNSSQLYFDTSILGHPPRLWRIVRLP